MTPSRMILTGAAGLLTAMGLVAVGGTAAATSGNWAAVSLAAGPSSGASASNSPGTPPPGDNKVFFASCHLARLAGAAPIERGEPGYRRGLDRDHDGVACERDSDGDGRDDDGDDDGKKGRDGSDGDDGKDGKDGKDGRNGRDGVNASTGSNSRTGQIVGSYDIDLDPPATGDGFSQIGSDDVPYGSVATG